MTKHPISWQASLKALTIRALGTQKGESLWLKYHSLLPADYQLLIAPRAALKDICQLESLLSTPIDSISLIRPHKNHPYYRLHFYSLQERYLDEFMPLLENLSFRVMDQVQFTFAPDGVKMTIKSFTIKAAKSQYASLSQIKTPLLNTIHAVMSGRVENDALNQLCVLAGMEWQAIDLLRAYRNYYLQLGHPTTIASFHHALIHNPNAALGLFQYFEARFRPNAAWEDPMDREKQVLFPIRMQLLANIDAVTDLNDDRILRTVFNLIDATVRSNFHQRISVKDYYIAFKINSLGIIELPSPKPQVEIYVHSVNMEGIHLRGGKISRGGIRWSDRLDDFRTEILGLMQTQISKNALIIPTGAKGGFVVKSSGSVQDIKTAGKRAYLKLIRGILDLTDNYVDGKVISPAGLVTHDDSDPYLVVAADKGTASFSDMANAVAAEYDFWLDDAFASGGSHGYDHKTLGITARGAWECVKRHFLEMGKDIQQEAFTVIGIGSMDGDVFGNGMLLSPKIRLLAAFSGQHIFIDPSPPDDDTSLQERQRLFSLPGSTWHDYERRLISTGGGVFDRVAKDIPVSAELKKWLGIRYKSIDGETLIRYLLATPVELLWLGGIGTYVKASTEKHEEVGDRNNDNVRINATELGAKVVGEGANLGFTQKARIEYSLRGGRINTDAVDNSAGVDTSDHEVNLKILLSGLHKQQLIADYQVLFMDMTEAVCQLVLADNIAQSLCLSLDQLRCAENPAVFLQVADHLEAAGFLDRTVESFAPSKEVQARAGQCLSRPELAVLMAASKLYLTRQLQSQPPVLQDECYDRYLHAYFPPQLIERFRQHLAGHPLANEIKATVISNKVINQAGSSFLSLTTSLENADILNAVSCYLTFDQALEADEHRQVVAELENKVATTTQYQLLLQLEHILADFCRRAILHNKVIMPDAGMVNTYRRDLAAYAAYYEQDSLQALSAVETQQSAFTVNARDFLFISQLATEMQQDFTGVMETLHDINQALGLQEIQEKLAGISLRDNWEKKAVDDLLTDIESVTSQLLRKIMASRQGTCTDFFELEQVKQCLKPYRRIYQDILATSPQWVLPYVTLIRSLGSIYLL